MTTTAMKNMRDFIISNLKLLDLLLLVETPEKVNINVIKRSSSDDCKKIFALIIAKLAKEKCNMERIMIFFRTRRWIREIYQAFHSVLGHEYESYKTRPYAMFHSTTDNEYRAYFIFI